MRITKIEVNELFGTFNHEIPLNSDEHITIMHGPNGFGKTILLTLLNDIFNGEFKQIQLIPFNELKITFANNDVLFFIKESGPERGTNILNFGYTGPGERIEQFRTDLNTINKLFPPSNLPSSLQWVNDIRKNIEIHFIETERLLSVPTADEESDQPTPPPPSVILYSHELAFLIQAKLAEYGTLSQSLDRNFPSRLVKGMKSNGFTEDKLKKELNQLEEKRKQLMATGFLDKEKEIDFKDFLKNIDESNVNVLSVYVEDVKKKLSVFDQLTEKVDLLIKIINRRFLYKQLSISKTDGFIFTTSSGERLSPDQLSSGEQHELVLLYQLLFKVKPESLILMDEPELSLHVHWQQQFLVDLQEITKLVGFDILIATHSPQIINDRWDLTIELKGPKL